MGIWGGLQFNSHAQTTLTLPELLQTRFTAAVTATTYENCEIKSCYDPAGCSQELGTSQIDILTNEFVAMRNDLSRTIEVVCEPGDPNTTGVEQVIDLSDLQLPITLYRIRLCSGEEGYVLGDDSLAAFINYQPYQIIQEILITSYSQEFTITIDGVTSTVNLETLLSEIFLNSAINEPITIDGYQPCGQEVCETITTECTPTELELQNEIVEYLQRNTIAIEDITYSITLHLISLCGNATLWITDEELDAIDETPIQTIETITLTGPDDPIIINDPVRGTDYIDDISITTTDPTCDDPNSGSILITITGAGASEITQFSIDGGDTYQSSPLFQNLPDGGYIIRVSNSDGSISASYDEVVTLQNPCLENDRESCSDGIDNDGDGLVDCDDEECGISPDCNPDVYCEVFSTIKSKLSGVNIITHEVDQSELRSLPLFSGQTDEQITSNLSDLLSEISFAQEEIIIKPQGTNFTYLDTSYFNLREWKQYPFEYAQENLSLYPLIDNTNLKRSARKTATGEILGLSDCTAQLLKNTSCDYSIEVESCTTDGAISIYIEIMSDSPDGIYNVNVGRLSFFTISILESRVLEKGKYTFTVDGAHGFVLINVSKDDCSISEVLESNGRETLRFDLGPNQCLNTDEIMVLANCTSIHSEACPSWQQDNGNVSSGDVFCPTQPGSYEFKYSLRGVYLNSINVEVTFSDVDGDGIKNNSDNDVDGDGLDNNEDTDDDGDGIPDINDPTPIGN